MAHRPKRHKIKFWPWCLCQRLIFTAYVPSALASLPPQACGRYHSRAPCGRRPATQNSRWCGRPEIVSGGGQKLDQGQKGSPCDRAPLTRPQRRLKAFAENRCSRTQRASEREREREREGEREQAKQNIRPCCGRAGCCRHPLLQAFFSKPFVSIFFCHLSESAQSRGVGV